MSSVWDCSTRHHSGAAFGKSKRPKRCGLPLDQKVALGLLSVNPNPKRCNIQFRPKGVRAHAFNAAFQLSDLFSELFLILVCLF